MERYFNEPYRFVPPYRSTFWCRLMRPMIGRRLQRRLGVRRWRFDGLEALRDSLARGAGILLTPNHCRWPDPVVMGALGIAVNRYFYYIASYHLFRHNPSLGRWLNRLGGYSILREGADRESIRATVNILASAERPVVLFPEGTWFRQNDRLGPLQEGVGLITRQAMRGTERPILVHPVALKYWVLEDIRPLLGERLSRLEASVSWPPQTHLDLPRRLEKIGEVLLGIKEVEQFGKAQPGTLDGRVTGLMEAHVGDVEREYSGKVQPGRILDRIRRLRQRLVAVVREHPDNSEPNAKARRALDRLLFSENLSGHSWKYLEERPTLERLAETVQRIEETVFDQPEEGYVPLGVVVRVGPPIDVRTFEKPAGAARQNGDPLMGTVAAAVQHMLDQLNEEGPPPEWNCPPTLTPVPVGHNGQDGSLLATRD